jgi:hypothetical protein
MLKLNFREINFVFRKKSVAKADTYLSELLAETFAKTLAKSKICLYKNFLKAIKWSKGIKKLDMKYINPNQFQENYCQCCEIEEITERHFRFNPTYD